MARPRRKKTRRAPAKKKDVAANVEKGPENKDVAEAVAEDDASVDDLPRILEALLFAAHEPLPLRRIASALGRVSSKRQRADGMSMGPSWPDAAGSRYRP